MKISFASAEDGGIQWKAFQVGGVATYQADGSSTSGILRYEPRLLLNERWNMGVSIDVGPQKLSDSTQFTAIGYMAYGLFHLNDLWSLQLSVGSQTWTCSDCGSYFAAGPSVRYGISTERAAWLKDVWLQYLTVASKQRSNQALAGIGMEF